MLRAVTSAQRTVTLNESVRHRVEAQRYLRELVLPLPALKAVLREYLLAIDQSIQRVSRLEELIATHVPTWSRYPIVQALMCLRGFQLTAAAVLVAELGDVQRFQHPRHLMAFFGLIPREHTTGLVEALSYSAFPPATMKSPTKTKTIAITIALPIRDYETYLAAAKFLAPTLKRKAPDPRSLRHPDPPGKRVTSRWRIQVAGRSPGNGFPWC